jgi:hypothetical protein
MTGKTKQAKKLYLKDIFARIVEAEFIGCVGTAKSVNRR